MSELEEAVDRMRIGSSFFFSSWFLLPSLNNHQSIFDIELTQANGKNSELQQKLTHVEQEFELLLGIFFFFFSSLRELGSNKTDLVMVDDMIAKEEEKEVTGPVHVAPETLRELKDKLEAQYASKKQEQIKQLEDLRMELAKKENELERQKKYLFFLLSFPFLLVLFSSLAVRCDVFAACSWTKSGKLSTSRRPPMSSSHEAGRSRPNLAHPRRARLAGLPRMKGKLTVSAP